MKVAKIIGIVVLFAVIMMIGLLVYMQVPGENGYSPDDEQRIIGAVKHQMKDPDTAKIEKLIIVKTSEFSAEFCGFVNAKNSFGAYVGPTLFTGDYALNPPRVIGIMVDSDDGYSKNLIAKCAGLAVLAAESDANKGQGEVVPAHRTKR
jgi:hypothetical protein